MKAIRIFILLLAFLFTSTSASAWQSWEATVVNVTDGDTITVLTPDKRKVKIRLYGIDCPEKKQAFGKRAKRATKKHTKGQPVATRTMGTDRYGRTVGVVYLPNGYSLNELLVNDGLAWVYPRYCTKKFICTPLKKLETAARIGKRGLWGDKNSVEPWRWRKQRR